MPDRQETGTGWSLQLGRALGIPIRVHFTFLLLLVWYGVYSSRRGDSLVPAVGFLLSVFGCVVLHELGHAAVARRYGVHTRDIVLYPIGGIARLERIPAGAAELWIALAGPMVNLALAALLLALLLTPVWSWQPSPRLVDLDGLLSQLLVANVLLFGFNLIPAFPMDGGRILRSALTLALTPTRATEIATTVGQAIAILFGLAGLLSWNPVLVLIALFVFLGASQEAWSARERAAVHGHTAREAMVSRFEVLAPEDSLERAARCLLATHQQDFPVVDAWRRVVGMLSRARLLEGLAQAGSSAAVLEVMDRNVVTVPPGAGLTEVLDSMRRRGMSPVMVVDGDDLVGMITLDNLGEFIEVSRRGSVRGTATGPST